MGLKSAEFLKQGNLDAKFLEGYGEKLNNLDNGILQAFPASSVYFQIDDRSKKVFKAVQM